MIETHKVCKVEAADWGIKGHEEKETRVLSETAIISGKKIQSGDFLEKKIL